MDKDLERWYEQQFALFAEPGWKDFIDQVQEIRDSVDKLNRLVTPEDLYRAKGELKNIDWILGWPRAVEAAYNAAKEGQ